METTFMTIHNLSPDANILYASESIIDVLGYHPDHVINRSCFDYFHPEEVPHARFLHSRDVNMDKAAVLYYARIKNRDEEWVSCECVFTVVYDVLVACTSIYRGDEKNRRRAEAAPTVRRKFVYSPKDPRYHMLEYLSSKFRASPQPAFNEPRAALILNRFTRSLTVMYATNAVESILGVSPNQFKDKSFYECIRENCLPDAIRCIESAKANDSIAYLRFWYRNPHRAQDIEEELAEREASLSSDSEDGGVGLNHQMDIDANPGGEGSSSADAGNTSIQRNSGQASSSSHSGQETSGDDHALYSASPRTFRSQASPAESNPHRNSNTILDQSHGSQSSISAAVATPANGRQQQARRADQPVPQVEEFELEAIVSCTSDGLVVVLRRARPVKPFSDEPVAAPALPQYANGLFAAPWGANPIRPHVYQPNPQYPFQHGIDAPVVPPGAPAQPDFMHVIQQVAVFAWGLTGINGNIKDYGHGNPLGEAVPQRGLPVYDPYGQPAPGYEPPHNQAEERWIQRDEKRANDMGVHSRVPPQVGYGQNSYEQHSYNANGTGANRMGNGVGNQEHAPQRSLGGGYVFQGPGSWVNNGYANQYGQNHGQYNNYNNNGQPGPSGQNQGSQEQQNQQHDGQEGQGSGPAGDRYLWY